MASSSKSTESAEAWLLKGNIYFKSKDYASAVKYYTNGLNVRQKDAMLLSNRCMAYLKLRCFRRALEDANLGLEIQPSSPKNIYRKVKALFGLELFETAIEFIIEQQKSQPDAAGSASGHSREILDLDKLLSQANLFLHQQLTGDFNMTDFLKNHKTKYHECADFIGPVQITDIDSIKGRGLRATKEIKKGQLVIVSKAICMLYEGIIKLPEIHNRITYERELLNDIYNLYAGPELNFIPKNDPNFDYTKIDLERLEKAFILNNFTHEQHTGCFYDTGTRSKSNGLWYFPSFVNHSCFECNCSWTVYGDVMFIRALRDIGIGDEVLISYCKSIGVTYAEKMQLFKRFGFDCTCTLCQLDKQDEAAAAGVHQSRNQLLEQLKLLESSQFILPLLEQLEKLSEGRNPMYLVDPYFDLGLAYSDEENYLKAAESMIKAYEIISGTAVSHTIVLVLIWNIIHELIKASEVDTGCFQKAKDWVVTLKNEAKVIFGANSDIVLKTAAADFVRFLKQNKIEF